MFVDEKENDLFCSDPFLVVSTVGPGILFARFSTLECITTITLLFL